MRKIITEHVFGAFGQVAAALPPIIVLIVLSRSHDLETAGQFTVVIAISATCFAVAQWGLRTAVVVDRFDKAAPKTYLLARMLTLTIASSVVLASGYMLGASIGLVFGLILYKICDGLLDLDFAVTQVATGTKSAINGFARQQSTKLIVLSFAMAIVYISSDVSMSMAYIASGVFAIMLVGRQVVCRILSSATKSTGDWSIGKVLVNSSWFAIALVMCSLVASAPRISLPWLYAGESLGVVGVTLSVGPIFGMVFYTAWVRHLPRFGRGDVFRSVAMSFLIENLTIAFAALIASWWILPSIVAHIFDFSAPPQLVIARQILLGTVIFFSGMNSCNLYKVTSRRWLETSGYATALVFAATTAFLVPEMRKMHLLLTESGLVMLVFGLSASIFSYPKDLVKTADAGVRS